MEYFLLDELSNILREGVCDLNVAAKRLRVALPVVERTFADGVLKGYWKVANGKLLIKSHHHHRSTGCDHVPPVHLPPEIAWNPGTGYDCGTTWLKTGARKVWTSLNDADRNAKPLLRQKRGFLCQTIQT